MYGIQEQETKSTCTNFSNKRHFILGLLQTLICQFIQLVPLSLLPGGSRNSVLAMTDPDIPVAIVMDF